MGKYEPKMYGQRSVDVTVVCTVHADIEQEMGKTAWTLNSWNSSFSPQSVTLAPHVAYWATNFMLCTWVRFISLLEESLASFGDLEKGLVHSFHPLILRPHLVLTSHLCDLSLLWQPFTLPASCSFISYLFSHFQVSKAFSFLRKINSWWCGCEQWPGFETFNKERQQLAKYEEGVSSCKLDVQRMSPHTNFLAG